MLALQPVAASATGGIHCEAFNAEASVSMSVGRVPALAIVGASITIGDKRWSTDPVEGESSLFVNQAFENEAMLLVDFASEAAGTTIASLRSFNLFDTENFVSGGVFSMIDEGSWVVDCSLRE